MWELFADFRRSKQRRTERSLRGGEATIVTLTESIPLLAERALAHMAKLRGLSPLIHEHINIVGPLLLCGTGIRGPWQTQAAAHSRGR